MPTGPSSPQMSLLAGLPASPSPSPASERDWLIRVVTWPSHSLAWLTATAPAGWSGRTSPASCRRLTDGTLAPSSEGWGNSGIWDATACLTLNSSDWPSGASVCSLSAIVETGAHLRRYCLSPKACQGILRRAAKRGRELPRALYLALLAVSGEETTPE